MRSPNLMNQKVLYRLISNQCYSLKIERNKRNVGCRPFIPMLSFELLIGNLFMAHSCSILHSQDSVKALHYVPSASFIS